MAKPQDLNGHSGNNEIGTPVDLFQWLNCRFTFDYDPFATHENRLCAVYSTIEGTFGPHGVGEPVSDLDGLHYAWKGYSVFWNPPYGRGIFRQAIEKALEERNNVRLAVGLVKYDPSTETGRLLRENFHLEYLPRVKYRGMETAATFASVLAITRPDRWKP